LNILRTMEKKLPQKRDNTSLIKVQKQLEYVNNIIAEVCDREILCFARRNPLFFIDLISGAYCLDYDKIKRFDYVWNWKRISNNNNVSWSENIINEYSDNLDWVLLSKNPGIPWDNIQLIDKLKNKLVWEDVCRYNKLTEKFIIYFENIIFYHQNKEGDRSNLAHLLSSNPNVEWNLHLLKKYEDFWKWDQFGICENKGILWTIEMLDYFTDRIGWQGLSRHGNVFFSPNLLIKYQSKLSMREVFNNDCFKLDHYMIETLKNIDITHWYRIKSLNWTKELLLIIKNQIKASPNLSCISAYLSRNNNISPSIKNDPEFRYIFFNLFYKYEFWHSWSQYRRVDNWEYGENNSSSKYQKHIDDFAPQYKKPEDDQDYILPLSYDNNFPWSIEMLDLYKDFLDWKGFYYEGSDQYLDPDRFESQGIGANTAIKWSKEIIDRYLEFWDWRDLSINPSLPWSIDFVNTFFDKWDWETLSRNKALPWSIEFIEAFQDKWNYAKLSGNGGINFTEEILDCFSGKIIWSYNIVFNSNLHLSKSAFYKLYNLIDDRSSFLANFKIYFYQIIDKSSDSIDVIEFVYNKHMDEHGKFSDNFYSFIDRCWSHSFANRVNDTLLIRFFEESNFIDLFENAVSEYNLKREHQSKNEFRYEELIRFSNIVIKIDPFYSKAYSVRGISYYRVDNYESSILDFTWCISNNHRVENSLYYRGRCKMNLELYKDAIDDFNSLLDVSPDDEKAYFYRAYSKNEIEDFFGAIEDYTKSIFLSHDTSCSSYNNRALIKSVLGEYLSAISDFTKAIEISPKETLYIKNRAECHEKFDNKSAAKVDYILLLDLGYSDHNGEIKKKIESLI
jgi:tetratricopeptide (TPR) repeat protein